MAATKRRDHKLTGILHDKLQAQLAAVEETGLYRLATAPETDARTVATLIKYILLEVFSYGPHVTEATFTAIGRFPKNRPDLMKPMIVHDLSEVDHGEMALRDYIRLGGDEREARARRITPESFCMSATCRLLATAEEPWAYLGYMYLFESLTPVLTERAQSILAAKSFPGDARHFIDFHAKEDIGHSTLLADLIDRVTADYPEAAAAIEYGFDCFAAVYPIPIWDAALRHAQAELSGGAPR
jgi:hypothetical protein